jgi:hypothetical protein
MPGHKKTLLRRKLGGAPLPVAALAALVAGSSTLMIWQSPGNLVADVKPLIMDFGRSKVQSSSEAQAEAANRSLDESSAGSNESGSGIGGPYRRSREPVRTERSNGGLVLEWPQQEATKTAEASDAKSQAKRILEEAEEHLLVGDLRRALTSARLAYSYPVKWEQGEQSPEELLAKLEALASDPTFVASARRDAVNRINSANNASSNNASTDSLRPGSIVDSMPDRQTAIGVWNPAPASGDVALATQSESPASNSSIETVSGSGVSGPQLPDFPAIQPYQSQSTTSAASNGEPGRLKVDTHRQVSESTAEFAAPAQFAPIQHLEPRPLIITDQRAAAPAASPIGTLTFDVLATLTTIFAVLFFGALFLFLAILAVGKKLIGENGVAFRIELVNNSPLTIQAAGMAAAAAPAEVQPVATDELKIDPDFEGILSLSEQRARQRESAILEQFIQNNVSLHNEIGASRAAA